MDEKAVRGHEPSLVIYDELAESSYEMARRRAETEALRAEQAKLRAEINAQIEADRRRDEARLSMWKKPPPVAPAVISEARVREELGKSRGFRDLKPLMNYLKDTTDVLADKAERFDGVQLDLEDQKDLNNRLAEGLKVTRNNLAAANEQLADVRKYLDELTELAATFGSEASTDLATIVKNLARALGEEG